MRHRAEARSYSHWLMAFLALFVFRVLAQLVQSSYPVSFLPPFEAWHSGALPYRALLGIQLLIIAYCAQVVRKFRSNTVTPSSKTAKICITLGGIYFFVMLFRLTAGLSFASDHLWLGVLIPTLFHLVLASFLLTVGFFHSVHADKIVARTAYPMVMLTAITTHCLCVHNGVNLQLATFAPVMAGALIITFLELKFPYRVQWLANGSDIMNDATYMALVQVLMPMFLGFMVAILLLNTVPARGLAVAGIWPNNWPVYMQAMLMLITAELLRYWVHRLAHQWIPLWRLHAVHHSPHKLYWLNVGRFHPLEKSLQYLFDALPFIVLGVSEEVLALYFVFYGVNGFFQHCNINLRMGFLNYIISGPELHRWHHSMLIEESNNNYGNNLIVWDLIFGTWFLPKHRSVLVLGLANRKYPMSFASQLKTPFIKGSYGSS